MKSKLLLEKNLMLILLTYDYRAPPTSSDGPPVTVHASNSSNANGENYVPPVSCSISIAATSSESIAMSMPSQPPIMSPFITSNSKKMPSGSNFNHSPRFSSSYMQSPPFNCQQQSYAMQYGQPMYNLNHSYVPQPFMLYSSNQQNIFPSNNMPTSSNANVHEHNLFQNGRQPCTKLSS